MSVQYSATSLAEIADHFEMLADQQVTPDRVPRSQREREVLQARAQVWRDAAQLLRNTKMGY